METLLAFIIEHASYAHFVVFGLLILAGFNIPISEDLLVIGGGVLAATVATVAGWKLFLGLYLGAFVSDLLVFYLGWHFGHRLWDMRWFSRMISKKRLESLKHYYNKYGVFTLMIGRFIPFGVRNGLFLTAGMARMRLWKFILTDAITCLVTNSLLFTLAYYFAKNDWELTSFKAQFNIVVFTLFCVAAISFVWYKKKKTSVKTDTE